MLREFASIPTETAGCYTLPAGWGMRGAYDRALIRMRNIRRMVRMPKSKELAREMQLILASFERERLGFL